MKKYLKLKSGSQAQPFTHSILSKACILKPWSVKVHRKLIQMLLITFLEIASLFSSISQPKILHVITLTNGSKVLLRE